MARGCVRATAATSRGEGRPAGVEVRFQDEHDRVLLPTIVDTVIKAREALTRDLGATWPKPTRIVVVRDVALAQRDDGPRRTPPRRRPAPSRSRSGAA